MSKKPLTDKDGEVRELTAADFKKMRPMSELMPDFVKAQKLDKIETRSVGRPYSDNPKLPITIRLSPEVAEYFRATGKGWQTRMDEVLKEYVSTKGSG